MVISTLPHFKRIQSTTEESGQQALWLRETVTTSVDVKHRVARLTARTTTLIERIKKGVARTTVCIP